MRIQEQHGAARWKRILITNNDEIWVPMKEVEDQENADAKRILIVLGIVAAFAITMTVIFTL